MIANENLETWRDHIGYPTPGYVPGERKGASIRHLANRQGLGDLGQLQSPPILF